MNTFPKEEHLCGKTAIAHLMKEGKWGVCGHYKYCFLPKDEGISRVMVSVPKKYFKRAVKRNLLKRRTREAYRLQKDLLTKNVDILLYYNSPSILDSAQIHAEIAQLLQNIQAL